MKTINWRFIWALAMRDLRIVRRSKAMVLPIIIVPIILMVIPAAMALSAPAMVDSPDMAELLGYITKMPDALKAQFTGFSDAQLVVVLMTVYFFAPMFLMLPVMTASTIAAGSFAGEKERKTLEALLYTPGKDLELFLGKVLAAWIPANLVTLVSFVLYGIVVNAAGWPVMGRMFFPNATWIAMIVWVCPAAACLGLGTMILVSSKVSTFQDANQLGSMIVLPVMLLLLGQIAGIVYLTVPVALVVGLVVWIIDAVILTFAVRTFHRAEILAKI